MVLSLPEPSKVAEIFSCYNWFFHTAFSRVIWRRLGTKRSEQKSHDLADSLKTTECFQHFYCLLLFRLEKLFIVFPGHKSLRKLLKLFFLSDHTIYHLRMWMSLCSKRKREKKVWKVVKIKNSLINLRSKVWLYWLNSSQASICDYHFSSHISLSKSDTHKKDEERREKWIALGA